MILNQKRVNLIGPWSILEYIVKFIDIFRSSHRRCSVKKGPLINFAKFTGKHLYQSLFWIKLQALACNFIKKETLAQVFFCKFCEISKGVYKCDIGLKRFNPFDATGFIPMKISKNLWLSLVIRVYRIDQWHEIYIWL